MRVKKGSGLRLFAVLFFLGICLFGILWSMNSDYEDECEARGGHIGPKNLCLTPDGRVIEK